MIVWPGMDDEGRALLLENRVRFELPERNELVDELRLDRAGGRHAQVWKIAGMRSFRRFRPVLLVMGIEVHACRRKGRLTRAKCMDVNGVLAGRQADQIYLDQNTTPNLLQIDAAQFSSRQVTHFRLCDQIG